MLAFRITAPEKDYLGMGSQISEITGDGFSLSTGIIIPIHIKVVMLDDNKTIFDKTVATKNVYSFGYRVRYRDIAPIHLAPGKYVVTASTVEATSLPVWIETGFVVGRYSVK
jgi:hypothetical protein